MSMNFNIYKGKPTKHCDKFNCWQTPTVITEMIMVQPDGSVAWELTGKKALHSIEIYKRWVMGKTNGVWNSTEELNEMRNTIIDHLEELEEFLGDKKNVRTIMM